MGFEVDVFFGGVVFVDDDLCGGCFEEVGGGV